MKDSSLLTLLYTVPIRTDDVQVLAGIEPHLPAEGGQGDEPPVDLRDGGQHPRVFCFQPAAVDHVHAAGPLLDKAGDFRDVRRSRRGLAGPNGPDRLIGDDGIVPVGAGQAGIQLLAQHLLPVLLFLGVLAHAVEHAQPRRLSAEDLLVQEPAHSGAVGDPRLRQDPLLVRALLAVADEGGGAAQRPGRVGGAQGRKSADIAPHSGVRPVDALAPHLDGAVRAQRLHRAQQVGLRVELHKLHLRRIVALQALLGGGDDVAPPPGDLRQIIDPAPGAGDIKPLQVQKNMFQDAVLSSS